MLFHHHQVGLEQLPEVHMAHVGVGVLGPAKDLPKLRRHHIVDMLGLLLVAVMEEKARSAPFYAVVGIC